MLKMLRSEERRLIYYASLYLAVGMLAVYLNNSGLDRNYLLLLLGGTGLGFWLVSIIWRLRKFYCDPYFLPLTAVLCSTGLVFLYRLRPEYAYRQFIWILVGLLCLVLLTLFLREYQVLADYKYIYVAIGLVLLLLPIFFGREQGGAKSWLSLGLFEFQPSEFVKILMVLFLAGFLEENKRILTTGTKTLMGITLPGPREWGPLVVMWGVSLLLLIFQKDLGTALIYFCTFLALVYVATARIVYIVFGLLLFMLGAFGAYHLYGHVAVRVDVWLNPWPVMATTGYQIVQSLFAIGSGGVIGSGLGAGMPGLIPAVHTDFIFSAICEEMGLLGDSAVIILYMLLVFRGLKVSLAAADDFAALLASGLTALLGLQTFIIIAGVTKLLPMTGVTLPFISYGGSSLVANFILLGLLLNISHEVNSNYAKEH